MATITKNKLWPKPEYTAIIAEKGRLVAFFIKSVRDALPARCPEGASEADYASFVADARDNAMALTTVAETANWWETTIIPRLVGDFGYKFIPVNLEQIITKKVMKLQVLAKSERELREAAYVARFGMSEEERILADYTIEIYDNKFYIIVENEKKKGSYFIAIAITGKFSLNFPVACGEKINPASWRENTYFAFDKKTKIVVFFNGETREKVENAIIAHAKATADENPPKEHRTRETPLAEFRFSGLNVRGGKNVTEEDLKNTFNLRNIYFGQSMPKGERQAHLNKAYESMYALSYILGIEAKDIGLDNFVSLSFGARGRRGARAHYEFKTGIINLTRGCGAGTLAHEWGHALEAFIKKNEDSKGKNDTYSSIKRDMRYYDGKDSFYYQSSLLADRFPKGAEKRYWSKESEMFARAFACFMHDKFTEANITADYLVVCSENDVHPDGDERSVLNHDFENLFTEMKNRSAFHAVEHQEQDPGEAVQTVISSATLYECSNGQFNLFEPIAATRA